jgi:UDP-3-O-[3-hydroxymyristoyl] glucosamine N-acyltransferase
VADKRFYTSTGPLSLDQIIKISGATLVKTGMNCTIEDVQTLAASSKTDLSFLHNAKYVEDFKKTEAGCVLVTPDLASFAPKGTVVLTSPTPYRAYAQVASHLYPLTPGSMETIPPKELESQGVIVELGAVIFKGAEIGTGTFIGANAVIGCGVKIGTHCHIGQNVTLSHALIGDHVTILPGSAIGQAGFGFFMDEKGHVTVPQLGRVILEDKVEIGANVTIDRGTLDDTYIGYGTHIDNLVQIAHGVRVGRHCVLVAQVGISGSTTLGNFVIAAGQAGLTGHLTIGNNVKIAAQSGVMRDVAEGETIAGSPAVPVYQWHRQTVSLAKLAAQKKEKSGDK